MLIRSFVRLFVCYSVNELVCLCLLVCLVVFLLVPRTPRGLGSPLGFPTAWAAIRGAAGERKRSESSASNGSAAGGDAGRDRGFSGRHRMREGSTGAWKSRMHGSAGAVFHLVARDRECGAATREICCVDAFGVPGLTLFVCLFVCLWVDLFARCFICLLFVCSFVHLFACLAVCLSVRPSFRPSVCLFVRLCACTFVVFLFVSVSELLFGFACGSSWLVS